MRLAGLSVLRGSPSLAPLISLENQTDIAPVPPYAGRTDPPPCSLTPPLGCGGHHECGILRRGHSPPAYRRWRRSSNRTRSRWDWMFTPARNIFGDGVGINQSPRVAVAATDTPGIRLLKSFSIPFSCASVCRTGRSPNPAQVEYFFICHLFFDCVFLRRILQKPGAVVQQQPLYAMR